MDMIKWSPPKPNKWIAVYDHLLAKRNLLDLETKAGQARDRKLTKLQRIAWKRYRAARGE
jgi:hypothetical protein